MDCYEGPLTGNAKCVVISILLAIGYWFSPPKNKWVLVGILYFTYIAIAWYDAYLCERTLTPSYLRHFYDWAKPRNTFQHQQYQNLCASAERKILIVDVIIAIAIVLMFPMFLAWKP
jgi:hypothetical protein